MTSCDVSAIAKPWEVQHRTAKLVAEEFFEQGDIEKLQFHEQPIAMMDRDQSENLPKMQIGFIDSICLPLYKVSGSMMKWLIIFIDHGNPMIVSSSIPNWFSGSFRFVSMGTAHLRGLPGESQPLEQIGRNGGARPDLDRPDLHSTSQANARLVKPLLISIIAISIVIFSNMILCSFS